MAPNLIKPPKLCPGDKIATVTLSWGGPGLFPRRYEAGKQQLEDEFGVTVVDREFVILESGVQ
ncbi:MAG: hypothetical protein FJ026_04245 [Chloroflexi bacterium]|nr:hypothetical protein [Chloroflexota bacterium]